jgi:hypothetical protein
MDSGVTMSIKTEIYKIRNCQGSLYADSWLSSFLRVVSGTMKQILVLVVKLLNLIFQYGSNSFSYISRRP